MIERLKHLKSTIFAVALTGAALGLVYFEKATLTEVSISIPAILTALLWKGKKPV